MEHTALLPNRANTRPAPEPVSILVVDPHDDTRQLYRQCFELADCSVVEASDGRDALAKALEREPSLVVTELRLSFIDGIALCELLRLDPATSGVPVLVVTGENRPAELERAQQAGADAVLMKPALPDIVLQSAMALLLKRSTDVRGRSAATRKQMPARLRKSSVLLARPDEQRREALCKSHVRFETMNPPAPPPDLTCPSCDHSLTYDHSHVGGVSDRHREQWDYYDCSTCGTFQYRQRTRKLRRVH
jgi:CheY-like chemotaxis protein